MVYNENPLTYERNTMNNNTRFAILSIAYIAVTELVLSYVFPKN